MRRPFGGDRQVDGALWAITSYFNPIGYRRRLANYHAFRKHLKVPLVTVELAYGADFELGDGDADILVHLRGKDVMWQKERLLNVALKALPQECRTVAWLDCDIVFEDAGWAEKATRLLDEAPLVQLFAAVHYMPPDLPPDALRADLAEVRRTSIAHAAAIGLSPRECLEEATHRVYGSYAPGFAWAARRDLIEEFGFYDTCIVGGGDRAMACATYGNFDHVIARHHMIDRESSRYLEWAESFHAAVAEDTACLPGNLFHLWHGDLHNRRMRERHRELSRFQFDPRQDIAFAENAVWRWDSEKPEMHAFVRNHFELRREDG